MTGQTHSNVIQSVGLFIQVLLLVTAQTHAWCSGADHYWPLDEIGYGRVHDLTCRPYHERWHGNIQGNKQDTGYLRHP